MPSVNCSITRYAVCGLSNRAIHNFVLPLIGGVEDGDGNDFSDSSEIVGVLDIDQERVDSFLRKHKRSIPFFSADGGVDKMIAEARPDVLLVTGPDHTHFEYIMAGLRAGLKVIAEKPLVINSEEARKVLEAEKESEGSLIVSHNYRYTPICQKIKTLLLEGKVGRVTNVEFVYNLDTLHGASYFSRWNRRRDKSGGLSVHKSVHHIDLINWLLDSVPETIFAFADRNYFGANGAHRPIGQDGSRLPLGEERKRCPYFRKHFEPRGVSPYQRFGPGYAEHQLPFSVQYPDDVYIYDQEIDVEDTYAAVIRYRNRAILSYSCNFSTPWEGFNLAINGTEGRLDVSHHSNPTPEGTTLFPDESVITLMPLFGGCEEHRVKLSDGGHGGADWKIQVDLFSGRMSEQSRRLGLIADGYSGAVAIAAGEAIWKSAQDGRAYRISELLGETHDS